MTDTELAHQTLHLKRNEDRRLRAGHIWVYSNEIDTTRSPLKSFQVGDLVNVESHSGRSLGTAYINPHSLICARIIGQQKNMVMSLAFFTTRIKNALALRERIFDQPYYRLIFGESDLLPGIVVDRYEKILVIQINTAAMDIRTDLIVAALQQVCAPNTIVLKNTGSTRSQEGLEKSTVVVKGEANDSLRVIENETEFQSPFLSGQKTGWFYDHRLNRARLLHYCQDRSVLDVFCYVGAWGVLAAKAGANEVVCVDSSKTALAYVDKNADINQVSEKVTTLQGDAFDALKNLKTQGKLFACINLDPPAFIKRKKDLKQGIKAYKQINNLAMQLLENGGILVSSSCSFHLSHDELGNILLQCALKLGLNIQILEQGHQAPDHPIHPAISETAYLKMFICRITHSLQV